MKSIGHSNLNETRCLSKIYIYLIICYIHCHKSRKIHNNKNLLTEKKYIFHNMKNAVNKNK